MSKKISRRRFLMLCGKIAAGAVVVSILPLKVSYKKVKEFIIQTKPFRENDLYDDHDLAG